MADPSCPPRWQLSAFCLGDLPPQRQEQIALHLDQCPACQESVSEVDLDELDRSDEFASHLRDALSGGGSGELPRELQQLIERASEIRVSSSASTRRPSATVVEPQVPDSPMPAQVGHYLLLEQIGEGGMGKVYRAMHSNLQKQVAVKLLPAERTANLRAVARFQREMRAVGRLGHVNIISAHDAGEDGGTHYLVTELVDGLDFSTLVRIASPLSVADACELIRQAAEGLDHAHQAGLVHRDVKPSNLMLDRSGTVKILDLGLAMLTEEDQELTSTGQFVGTIKYMAPEQMDGRQRPDARADIFSLGATLYRLLCGATPFSGPRYRTVPQILAAMANEPIRSPRLRRPELPEPLAELVLRMMARRPEHRPRGAGEVAQALAPFCQGADLPALASKAMTSTAGERKGGDERPREGEPGQTTLPPTADPDRAVHAPTAAPSHGSESPTSHWPLAEGADEPPTQTLAGHAAAAEHAESQEAERAARRRWAAALLALAVLLGGGVIGAQLFHLRVPRGLLAIEVNDPSVQAILSERGLQVVDRKSGRRYRVDIGQTKLPLGQYQLHVTDDNGLAIDTSKFVLNDENRRARISISLAPRPRAEPVARGGQFEPVHRYSLVPRPAPIEGLRSWTLDTRSHRGGVRVARFHPLGGRLATAGEDGGVRIWNTETLELDALLLGHDAEVAAIRWSPDGSHLASADRRGLVRLWKIDPQAATGSLEATMETDGAGVTAIAWPAAKRLACVDQQGGLWAWDLSVNEALMKVASHQGIAYTAAWAGVGSPIATAGSDGFIRLWDLGADEPLQQWQAHDGIVSALDWSPDGEALASSGRDGVIHFWRVGEQSPYLSIEAHVAQVSALQWSPAGDRICSVTMHGELAVWDAAAGDRLHNSRIQTGTVSSVDWHPQSDTLATATGSGPEAVRLWDAVTGQLKNSLASHPHLLTTGPQAAASSPDGRWIASVAGQGVRLWDTATWSVARIRPDRADAVSSVAWSPDSRLLAVAGLESLSIWDAEQLRWRAQVDAPALRPSSLAWSSDAAQLTGLAADGRIIMWTADADELTYRALAEAPRTVAWSGDGQLAVADRGAIRVFDDLEDLSGEPRLTLEGAGVLQLAFTPNGERLAVASNDKLVRLVDLKSGKELRTLATGAVTALAWSLDGSQLAVVPSSSSPVATWDAEAGRASRTFDERGSSVVSVHWTAGPTLVGAARDGSVRCWDPGTARLRCLLLPLGEEAGVAIGPTGHRAATVEAERELAVVAQSGQGQTLLSLGEFASKHGWQNDPGSLRPLADSPAR